MAAYNGRLLPRYLFGIPLPAVTLAATAFLLVVVLLLPVRDVNVLRPFIACTLILIVTKIYQIMKIGQRAVILPAINRARILRRAGRIYE